MLLKGSIRLRKGPTKYNRQGCPWVYSNELVRIDKTIAPGSWVALENGDGKVVSYGHFNPHSLIAFRSFERAPYRDEEQTRALFFKRLDHAWALRTQAYGHRFATGQMGRNSFRLAFGESDGVPGLVIDLYEGATGGGVAVVQAHSAGADNFSYWTQQWLEQRMGITRGVLRNDLEVRKREQVPQSVTTWGSLPESSFALEGGVRFFVDPSAGQKTGYFYDHRDNRAQFASRVSEMKGLVLDCFSYIGSWGLQALKASPALKLVAVDVSKSALDGLRRNAEENGLVDRVELVQADFFKDRQALAGGARFVAVVSDPPSLTSSAKQVAEGRRAHGACFSRALEVLAPGGLAALASCSFHLSWDEFLGVVGRAGFERARQLRISFVGSQSADHPILATLPETRYLKAVFVDDLDRWTGR